MALPELMRVKISLAYNCHQRLIRQICWITLEGILYDPVNNKSGNGFVLKRQLAITLTNVDPLHIETWTKWLPLCMWHIQLNILNGIYLYFDWNVKDFFPHRFNWYHVTVGSSTHSAPYWGQAIGWSSDDQKFADIWSLGLNELKYLWAWDQRRQFSFDVKISHAVGTQKGNVGLLGSAWIRG